MATKQEYIDALNRMEKAYFDLDNSLSAMDRFKDIKLLKDLKKQGFFKKIPSIATIKDILDNCEVTE